MDAERARFALEAEQLQNNALLTEVLQEIEKNAIELAISAPVDADALRAAALGEVRAVRSFISKLNTLVSEAKHSRPIRSVA